jgi:hypothetical protein
LTKDEIVAQINDANTAVVFAMLSSWMPFLNLPLISFVARYYISKAMKPEIAEGVIFVRFKAIDFEQLQKAKAVADSLTTLKNSISSGDDQKIQKASDQFDDSFRAAISLTN